MSAKKTVTNTANLNSPASTLMQLGGMSPFGSIEAMEARGQVEFVASDVMPTRMRPSPEAFEALGFKFGPEVDGDPLFRYAELPPGWRKQPTDHDMWSKIVDAVGVERIAVFYKAAFYDRTAHATIQPAAAPNQEMKGATSDE